MNGGPLCQMLRGSSQAAQWLRIEAGLLWLVPGFVVMGLLFVAPIALMIWASFTDPATGLQNYAHTLSDTLYIKVHCLRYLPRFRSSAHGYAGRSAFLLYSWHRSPDLLVASCAR
jgi:ABC-type sugar transport system permease subunit